MVKILGIYIGHDKKEMEENNFKEKIDNIKVKLNIWKQRNLTLFGRILIIKTFALSQLLYVASLLCVTGCLEVT